MRTTPPLPPTRLRAELMEERILHSADVAPLAWAGTSALHASVPDEAALPSADSAVQRHEIVFVDAAVPDADSLLADLHAQRNAGRPIEIVTIAAGQDGLALIGATLAGRHDIGAVHVLAHGDDAELRLGSTALDAAALLQHAGAIAAWGDALSADADLLIYGCDLAAGALGQRLVQDLAALTGADVAASTDPTGAVALGGDWVLEAQTGRIDHAPVLSATAQARWRGLLATYTVTTSADTLAAGSLRWAISQANANAGADTVVLPAGNYSITRGGGNEDNNATGDFDVLDSLTVSGAGANTTSIDGGGLDRVFQVIGSTVTMSGVTVRNGNANDGGGIRLDGSSDLTLRDAAVSGNIATATGGGIFVQGALTLDRVTIDGNGADVGGGIYLDNGASAMLTNVTMSGNTAISDGGAVSTRGAVTVTNSTIVNNSAGSAGGINRQGSGSATLKNSLLANNTGGNASGALTSLGNNIDSGNTASLAGPGDQVNTDPLLGPLQYNGGTTKTHALLAGSTAINAGSAAGAPTTDQRGAARLGATDIGAYESTLIGYEPFAYAAGSFNGANGGSGWAAGWSSVGSSTTVAASGLQNPAVDMPVSGGTAQLSIPIFVGSVVQSRDLSSSLGVAASTTWLSFLIRPASTTPGDYAGLQFGSLSAQRAFIGTNGGQFVLEQAGGGGRVVVSGIAPQVGQTYLLTLRMDFTAGADNLTLYVNPTPGPSGPGSAFAASKNNLDLGTFTQIDLAGGQTLPHSASLDEIRVAGSYLDAAPALPAITNAAPVLDASRTPVLAAQTEDAGAPSGAVGTLVSSLVDFAGGGGLDNVSDADAGAQLGIALTAADTANGAWWFSTDGGTNWNALGAVADNNARLLAADSNTRLYFQPNADYNGSIGSAISFRAWDQVSGSNGALASTASNGGSTAFSSATDTASLTVTAVNDPLVDTLTATQDTTINSGSSINYGNSASLVVNRSGGNLGNGRALLQFDLSSIPVGATVTGATLQLQATANASPFMIDVYRLTEAWVEGNGGTSAANWNNRLPGTAWTNIDGASVDPTPAATWATLPPPGAGLHSWDLTTLVQAWQTGSSANHGILLGSAATGTTTVTYDSSEGATPPRLVVTYTLETTPVNTVPGAQSTNEDTAKVFSAANGNPISIADADAGGANNQVTLSVTNGSLTLAGMAGLSFTSGDGVADTSMTFRGTASAINTALNGLSYLPASNYNGSATLTLATKDSSLLSLDVDTGLRGRYAFENSGALGIDTSPAAGYPGTVSGATAVIDATRGNVLSLAGAGSVRTTGHFGNPANVTLAAWVNLASADSIGAEVISLGDSVFLRLDQSGGTLVGGIYNGTTWAISAYATTLAGTGWHHVAYSFDDAANAGTLYLDGVAVSSTGTSNSISYTLGANSFIGRHGDAKTDFDFDGRIDDARVYSRALTASEIATLARDLSMTDTDTVTITVVAVNDAPTATNLSAAETYTEDTLRNLTNVVVSDVDSADVTATLSLSNVAAGSLNAGTSGAVSSTFAGGIWTASGAIGDVNALLAGLTFTPSTNFSGDFTIATSVSDGVAAPVSGSKAMSGTAVNDAPAITSNGGGASAAVSVAENATAVTTVSATDADLPAQTLTYSISGGADAARFSINASTGVLSFSTAPNYEAPSDAGANNVYNVTVRVSDGTLTDTQAIAVTVTPVNDINPAITSNGGGASAAVSVAENATAVTTVTATDADLPTQTLTYSISGGADAARFGINASTGVLSFNAAPNYEAPSDAGADNVYDVTVRVSDGTLSDTQAIAVTVTPVNDASPVITSNGGGASAAVSVAENATAVTTVTATDADLPAQTLTYTISGGADAARFSINASTGVLSFSTAPNYEAPSDAGANNVYDVTVRVSDGTLTDTQAIAVTVTPVNDINPAITSNGGGASAAVSVAENATAVTTVTAADVDLPAQTLSYSISGGADAARFSINASTGVLSFSTAPNYEAPSDAGANNVYDVTVRVSDGTLTDTQAIAVTVTPVNDINPAITSNGGGASAAVSVAENATAVTTVTATDADLPAQTLTYSISGGADAARFGINASTGVLSFSTAPNYEAPSDAGANNVYDVTVRVSDGTLSDTQAIAVTVSDANEFPVGVVSDVDAGANGVAENAGVGTVVGLTANAIDSDATTNAITYALDDSAAGRFAIDAATGVLSVAGALDYEASTSHVVTVRATSADGSFATALFTIAVTNVNDAGVGAISDANVTANAVSESAGAGALVGLTAAAIDPDVPDVVTYSLTDNAGGRFAIDPSTGVVVVAAALDAETAISHNIVVRVDSTDGSFNTQTFTIAVVDVNENAIGAVSDTDAAANVADENATIGTLVGITATAVDADATNSTTTYTLDDSAGGRFAVNGASGVLTVAGPIDREAAPSHTIVVRATSADGSFSTQGFTITVNPANDNSPDITSDGGAASAAINVTENASAVTTVTATDADLPAQTLSYSIVGGADQTRFNIDGATGVLSFAVAPDYENPSDAGADNVYDVTVQASDGGLSTTQAISVTVNPANDNSPDITSDGGAASAAISVTENASAVTTVTATDADLPAQTLSYSIVGGADQTRFNIDGATGVLSFAVAPDYENPSDAGADNVYDVTVQASDGGLSTTQAISVTVNPANDNSPDITSDGGAASAAISVTENASAVTTVTATDADLPAQTLSYSIVGGADQTRFNIDGATGVLSFAVAPDYENPSDAGADNVYDVTVQASDGGLSTTQAISVTVNPANDNSPDITSDGGAASAAISVTENASAVTTVTATDADLPAQTLSYSIVGGADQTRFNIDGATGVLSFAVAPDYENPSDAGADNVYDVTVQASDGGLSTTQAISVTVNPANDNSPDITSDGGAASAAISVTENASAVTTVTATDADLPAQTLSYSIVGGADQTRFNIDGATGVLSFAVAPDYENPSDAGADNVYDVTVQASDGGLSTTQAISVTVDNLNDAPAGTDNTVSTNEDTAYTFSAADFGFSDAADSPAHNFSAVRINTLPAVGTLTNNGAAVSAGQSVTVADINAGWLMFTPAADTSGTGYASVSFQVQDDGGTASGGVDLDASPNTLTVNVSAINDAPVNAVPAAQSTAYNTPLVLSAANGNRIFVSDVDAAGASIEVGLSAINGLLTLSGVSGLTFTVGSNGSASMIFTGSLANVNAALDGLSFVPGTNFSGAAGISLASNDQGNTGTGGARSDIDSVAIAVNPPAALTIINEGYATPADASLNAPSVLGNDIDPAMGVMSVAAVNGDAMAVGGTIALPSGALLSMQADGTFTYDPNGIFNSLAQGANATESFTYAVNSTSGGTGFGTATITVAGVNDAALLLGANNLNAIDEDPVSDTGTLVSALIAGRVTDTDGGAASGIAVTAVTNTNGTWQYTTDSGGAWADFGGPTAAAARLLAADAATSVRFVPSANWSGTVTGGLTFRAWDQTSGTAGSSADTSITGGSSAFSTASASAGITVNPVNDAPIAANAIPNQTALEDTGFAFTLAPGTFADIDAGDTLGLSTRLASGAALPSWLAFDAATGTFSGTPSNADVGAVTIRVSAVDAGGARVFNDFTLTVSNVNDAPTLGAPIVDQWVGAGSSLRFRLPDATFTDADAGDSLRYMASLEDGSPLPQWLSFDPQTLTFTGTPGDEQIGAFMVRVTATDDAGAAAQARFAMIVAAPLADELSVIAPGVTPMPAPAGAPPVAVAPAATAAADPSPAPATTAPTTPTAAPRLPDAPSVALSLESASDRPRQHNSAVSDGDTTRPASMRLATRTDAELASALVPDFKALSLASMTKLLQSDELASALEAIQRQMLEPGGGRRTVVASAMVATGGLSVGYVVWLVRGGVLVSSMLSALPAWQMIDPLPVLAASRDKRDKRDRPGGRAAAAADDGDVERLFDDRGARPAPPAPVPGRAAAAVAEATETHR